MLDIQFVRDNPELVQQKAEQKNITVDVNNLLEAYGDIKKMRQEVEILQAKRNKLVHDFGSKRPTDEQAEYARKLRDEINMKIGLLDELNKNYLEEMAKVPNIFPDDTPRGGEEANKVEKQVGEAKKRTVKDHLAWGQGKGVLDFERGAKVAGNKFYYTKGSLVELEYACIQLALSIALKHGFTPITVPHMVNEKTANGTGFSPRGEEDQIYTIEGEELSLIATAEIPITGYHTGEILEAEQLPVLYAGISPAYRKEAGAYGKHSKGLYRVHQFNKVELYVFCEPSESEQWHSKLVEIEEELCQALEIPYQLVRIASGDLGVPAYKKYDIEYWSPVEGQYRELMSCSNVTDYQARRLQIRYRNEEGVIQFVHTLNATAMAFSRTAIALIENHQDDDGNVHIPKALQTYMNGKEVI